MADEGTSTTRLRFSFAWCWCIGQALTTAALTRIERVRHADDGAAQLEGERRPARSGEQQAQPALQPAVRIHRVPAVRVQLEVQVRVDAVRVTRVAHVADDLAGAHLAAVLQPFRVGSPRHALAAVVVPLREVVVEVDVVVGRAARAVEVEHAAGRRRVGPELDLPGLGGEGERALRRHHVDALMGPSAARLAEVVRVGGRAEDREHDRRRRLLRPRGGLPDHEGHEKGKGESDGSSGCRPERDHGGPKDGTVAEVSLVASCAP